MGKRLYCEFAKENRMTVSIRSHELGWASFASAHQCTRIANANPKKNAYPTKHLLVTWQQNPVWGVFQGAWAIILNHNLLFHYFHNVHAYILINFAIEDDDQHD